jgi:hypothetical protein
MAAEPLEIDMHQTEFDPQALLDLAADDLHAILRRVALCPFLEARPDANLIADAVAAGEELRVELDLEDKAYGIHLGARLLQSGILAANDETRQIFEAAGALLVAALNREPEARRIEIAEAIDDAAITASLSVGRCAESVSVSVGQPVIYSTCRVSEALPEAILLQEANSLH